VERYLAGLEAGPIALPAGAEALRLVSESDERAAAAAAEAAF
jgi:hypothetical protein